MPDYKKEWFDKAKVDYFSPFVNLWLSCNSWYNFHYASLTRDREHVNKLKTDTGRQNALYTRFTQLFNTGFSKEQKKLYTNLELLHYSLERADITTKNMIYVLKFSSLCFDFSNKGNDSGYKSIIVENVRRKASGELRAGIHGVDLGEIVMVDDPHVVFACLIELIYQVRCALVHGNLPPTKENHEVVKYCYLILYDLMEEFCT